MCRLFRQIGVVVIEITNATPSGKRGPVRWRFVIRSDDGRSILCRKLRRDFTRDHARLLVPRPKGASERVDHTSLYLMHSLLRKIFELKRAGVIGELMSERLGHEKMKLQSGDESSRGNLNSWGIPPWSFAQSVVKSFST